MPAFESKISITNAGYWKVITSNGIPNHTIGLFPLTGCGRPTALKEQDYTFVIPAYSSKGILWPGTVFDIPKPPYYDKPETAFGVAVNGVPFDPVAAEWWDAAKPAKVSEPTAWNLNPLRNDLMKYDLDSNNGHVQRDGAYHYHGFPYGLYNKISSEQLSDKLTRKRYKIVLLGWAFDGNPIYGEQCGKDTASMITAKSSYKLRTRSTVPPVRTDPPVGPFDIITGTFPLGAFVEDFWYDETLISGDGTGVQLDECNGHVGETPEFPHGVYHYHILKKSNSITDIGFPYIGRCYRLFTYGQGPNIFPKPR